MSKIVAVDFDGTLVEDEFPKIGRAKPDMIEYIKYLKSEGYKVILWTCRHGKYLADAVLYCSQLNLTFDAVNENIPEIQKQYGRDTRKVYADIYIDDKGVDLENGTRVNDYKQHFDLFKQSR